jgi:hypothetical protein
MRSDISTKFIIGGTLICLGIGFLLDQLNIFDFSAVIGNFWALIIIVVGVVILIRHPRNIIPGFIIIAVGVALQIDQFVDNFNIWNLWPLILVFVGLSMLLKWDEKKSFPWANTQDSSSEDSLDAAVMFWGLEKRIKSQNFKGGKVSVIFGGGDIDLREAKIDDKALLDISCIFGGVDVKLPDNVKLVNKGVGIMGAFENNYRSDSNESSPELTVTGSAIFGGVEIK